MTNHPLHKAVGKLISRNIPRTCQVIKDRACGGNQYIPFYSSPNNSRKATYCNVDIVILKNCKIRVIIEIEESDVKPGQVIGKFFASALSPYYLERSNKKITKMKKNVLFIQLLDTSKIKKEISAKPYQWRNIEKSINKIIPRLATHINKYRMYIGNKSDFLGSEGEKLQRYLKNQLKCN
jgi:hypothetical protein